MKKCSKCKIEQSKNEFCKDKYNKDGLSSQCKICRSRRYGKWILNNLGYEQSLEFKNTQRKYHLKNRYNITINDYDDLLKSQNGKCAVCESECPTRGDGRFCVDHNHKTGKVRGLLCSKCNLILGNSDDNIIVLTKAIEYLVKNT